MTRNAADRFKSPHTLERLAAIEQTITGAFATDPTWGALLLTDPSDPADLANSARYWKLFVHTAQRYPWTFTLAASQDSAPGSPFEAAATTVWYPPNSTELSESEEAAFPEFVADIIGEQKRDELMIVAERFAEAYPTEPHYYLSLLATHPDYRGRGLGMQLLRENLAYFDSIGEPTYLESSNPANDERYKSVGYLPHGKIELPSGLSLTTFWREPQGD